LTEIVKTSLTADNRVESSSTTWLTARAGTGTLTLFTATNTLEYAGCASGYHINEIFLAFDHSAIGAGDTIDSVGFKMTCADVSGPNITEVYAYDWGEAVATGDFVPGATLASATLLASYEFTGYATGELTFTCTDAFKSAIVKGGTTRLVVCTDGVRGTSAPAAGNDARWNMGDAASGKPTLTVNYTAGSTAKAIPAMRTHFYPPLLGGH
jgi:hypothetical protein